MAAPAPSRLGKGSIDPLVAAVRQCMVGLARRMGRVQPGQPVGAWCERVEVIHFLAHHSTCLRGSIRGNDSPCDSCISLHLAQLMQMAHLTQITSSLVQVLLSNGASDAEI